MIKTRCENLYEHIKNLNKKTLEENKENCIVNKTPEIPTTIKETVSVI